MSKENRYDTEAELLEYKHRRFWGLHAGKYYPEILGGIFPNKQRDVRKIMDLLYIKRPEEVQQVFIFGSAATYKCSIESDLDVGIELDYKEDNFVYEKQIEKEIRQLFRTTDIWNLDIHFLRRDTDNRFRQEVLKGVCIYNKVVTDFLIKSWKERGIWPPK